MINPIIVFTNTPPNLPSNAPLPDSIAFDTSWNLKNSTINAPRKAPKKAPKIAPSPKKIGANNIAPIIEKIMEPTIADLLAFFFLEPIIPIKSSSTSPNIASETSNIIIFIFITSNLKYQARRLENSKIKKLPGSPIKMQKIPIRANTIYRIITKISINLHFSYNAFRLFQ